jgi:hypothetical protein
MAGQGRTHQATALELENEFEVEGQILLVDELRGESLRDCEFSPHGVLAGAAIGRRGQGHRMAMVSESS